MRNVFRNKRRTITTMFGVVLALTLILVSWGMIDTVQTLLDRQFHDVERSDARVVLSQAATPGILEELESVAGVESAEGVVSVAVAVEANGERYGTTLRGFEPDTNMHGFIGPDGEVNLPSDGVLLGSATRDLLGIEAGDAATMEAAGVTEGRIARLITAENVAVTALGIIPGLVLGYIVAYEFMGAFGSDQFAFTLSMRWTTFALSALFILVVTLVSQWPGLRAIRRLDIAKIVRERAV